MNGHARALLVAAALALGACSTMRDELPVRITGRSTADELLAYVGSLRGMGETKLAAEVARQRKAAAGERADVARVKAALALSLAAQADDAEILALVDPVARRTGGDREATAMASFLQAMVHERRRLKESAAAAGTRLRDERKELEQQRSRADALQERAAELQRKLDALSELEKSLSDRDSAKR